MRRAAYRIRAVATAICLTGTLGTGGCIGMTGKPAGSPGGGGAPTIDVTPSPINFSNVVVGTTATQVLSVTNGGTADLTVTKVTATGPAFSLTGLSVPLTVPAGGTSRFSASFEPTAAGSDSGSLSIMSNADSSPMVIPWSGKALTAKTQLTVSPPSLTFGNITIQHSAQNQVKLTNSGNDDVSISSVSITGTGFSESGGASVNLTPGQEVSVNVTFGPKSTGNFAGTLTIASNAPGSPQKVQLSGAGVAVPTQHSVVLRWSASQSAAVAVIGYYIYRGTVSGGPYSRLNAAADTVTTYTDGTVGSGRTYYYVVTSVDSNNVQSGYSSQVSAAVP